MCMSIYAYRCTFARVISIMKLFKKNFCQQAVRVLLSHVFKPPQTHSLLCIFIRGMLATHVTPPVAGRNISFRPAATPVCTETLTFTQSTGYITQCSITPAAPPATKCTDSLSVGKLS